MIPIVSVQQSSVAIAPSALFPDERSSNHLKRCLVPPIMRQRKFPEEIAAEWVDKFKPSKLSTPMTHLSSSIVNIGLKDKTEKFYFILFLLSLNSSTSSSLHISASSSSKMSRALSQQCVLSLLSLSQSVPHSHRFWILAECWTISITGNNTCKFCKGSSAV